MSEDLITTYDIRGTEATGLTLETVWNIGKAFADWLPTDGRVLVAARPDQTQLAAAAIEGLRLQGRAVIDGGHLSKEQVIERTTSDNLSGSILLGFDELAQMTTVELYQHEGRLVTNETGLTSIREFVEAGNFVPAAVKGDLTSLV